jgi:hypothetical protein
MLCSQAFMGHDIRRADFPVVTARYTFRLPLTGATIPPEMIADTKFVAVELILTRSLVQSSNLRQFDVVRA